MSSILEALKELESDRARAAKKATSVVDVPSTPPRSLAPFIVLGGGLAIAVVAFGVYLWTSGARHEQPLAPSAPEVAARSASEPAAAPARGPDWLQRAEPPRARVAPPPSAPPSPVAAAPTPTERTAVPAATERTAAPAATERVAAPAATTRIAPEPSAPVVTPPAAAPPARPAPIQAAPVETTAPPPPKPAPARAGGQQVQMEALSFSSHVAQRTVTLLVNGSRATLHQGEALGGVEVQLIMADGAYLQRGADVFFIGKPR